MKNLYIFTSPSSKPDLYINIINYWISTYGSKDLGAVTLLKIQDNIQTNPQTFDELKYTKECIEKQMYSLVGGNYLSWDPRGNIFSNLETPKKINVSDEFKYVYKEAFAFISQREIYTNVLNKDRLSEQINNLFLEESEENFDVTGVVNRYLVLISTYLLARNHSLYSLEVHKRFSHNEEDLIHNLKPDDYTYHYLEVPKGIDIRLQGNEKDIKADISKKLEGYKESKIKWLSLLAKDKTYIVVEEVLKFAFSSNSDIIIKEAVHQSSRWERLNNLISKGMYPDDFEMREQRKITSSIIDLIQNIEGLLNDMR